MGNLVAATAIASYVASQKSKMVLSFWYRLTHVVLEKEAVKWV